MLARTNNPDFVRYQLDIFDDNELKLDIKKDVDRTYQDRPIFQHPKIKKILTNILFIWAKQNSSFSYR